MRAPQPSLIPRTVRGKDGHLPLDRRVVQPAPPALFARLPIANQLRKETPDGGLTHEVVTAPRNRVNSSAQGAPGGGAHQDLSGDRVAGGGTSDRHAATRQSRAGRARSSPADPNEGSLHGSRSPAPYRYRRGSAIDRIGR